MRRFEYEPCEVSYKYRTAKHYRIYDRTLGIDVSIATVYDVDDAETICEALSERDRHATNTLFIPSPNVRPDGMQSEQTYRR